MTKKEQIDENYHKCIVSKGIMIQLYLIKIIINKYLILLKEMITITAYNKRITYQGDYRNGRSTEQCNTSFDRRQGPRLSCSDHPG
jgi:hypothetical protein